MSRRLNIFGFNAEMPVVLDENDYAKVVAKVAPREKEGELLLRFLEEKGVSGKRRVEEIKINVDANCRQVNLDGNEIKTKSYEHFLVKLRKTQTKTGISVYTDLMLQIIEGREKGEYKAFAQNARRGKSAGKMPLMSDKLKSAEGELLASLRGAINDHHCRHFLREVGFEEEIRELSKDLFYSLKMGLNAEQAIRYMGLFYELKKLYVAPPVQLNALKETVALSVLTGEAIQLVHVKCLRTIYPKEGGVEILTDTSDVEIEGLLGRYRPKSEQNLFPRLLAVKELFEARGIKSEFTICISDEDLDLLFPDGSQYVSNDQRKKAYVNLGIYSTYLQKTFGSHFNFTTINTLAAKVGETYGEARKQVIRDLKSGGRKYLDPSVFEKDRVDHQFNYYQRLFGKRYDRAEARRSISEQLASVICLGELISQLGKNIILFEENRGTENKLIAQGKVPIVFLQLRDEARFRL